MGARHLRSLDMENDESATRYMVLLPLAAQTLADLAEAMSEDDVLRSGAGLLAAALLARARHH